MEENPSGGSVYLAFDSDDAGQQAALEAIEKNYQFIFGDEDEDKNSNANWVRHAEVYSLFLDEIFSMALNGYLRRNGQIDDSQVRKWPLKRLIWALERWNKLITSMLFYGNSYLLEYYLSKAKERRAALEKELVRRASPKRRAVVPASNPGEWLSADYVREKADFQKVFEYYLTGTKISNGEMSAFCPFEKKKQSRPSFYANLQTGLYSCKRCQESGNSFQLIMKIEGVSFPTALRKVAELGGVGSI